MNEALVDFNVSVILPAGGSGERFGDSMPKQYSKLLGQPLIYFTLTQFHRLAWVQDIILVVHKAYVDYVQEIVREHDLDKVTVVTGSHTRHRSIRAGVQAIDKVVREPRVVVIHDAVRPFLDESTIQNVAINANMHGAAGVTRPLVSTVIRGDTDGRLQESLDRTQYLASEMPQGFQYSIIKKAYDLVDNNDLDYGTECLLLALKYTGTRAKLITGPENLWKVTYKKDLYAAEGILKKNLLQVAVHFQSTVDDALFQAIEQCCSRRQIPVVQVTKEIESRAFNTHVFIHVEMTANGFDISKFNKTVNLDNGSVKTSCVSITPCVIHVYLGHKGDSGCRRVFEDFWQNAVDSMENGDPAIMYGIICKSSEYSRLSRMIVNLLWNRDEALSGQLFVIKDNLSQS